MAYVKVTCRKDPENTVPPINRNNILGHYYCD